MLLGHWFAQPWAFWMLASLPALGLLGLWDRWRKRRVFPRLGNPTSVQALIDAPRRRFWRGLCLTAGLLCLTLGVSGPQWGRDYGQSAAPGRDLVVVLDCSRSMFAETPSRLERAKTALLDLSQTIQKHGGARLALVLFAGRARLVCPLTHDYDHFRDSVESVETDAADPELEPGPDGASGTRIGAALHEALLAHDPRPEFHGAQDILLLSDGDDPDPAHAGEWREGAADARADGVPVYTVGIGDPDPNAASVIRIDGQSLKYQGVEVRTHLQEAPLREIAEMTHGAYIAARMRTLSLGQVYLDATAGLALRPEDDDRLPVYQQHYAWFLAAAFVLLVLAVGIGDRRPRVSATEDGATPATVVAPLRSP